MQNPKTKALLISAGENPEPVIYTINELNPECLCFFVPEDRRQMINEDIIPALKERPAWMAEIVSEDGGDLLSCYRAITEKWGELQKNWRLEPGDWVVDYGSGTPSMAAALVLTTIDETGILRSLSGGPSAGEDVPIEKKTYLPHQMNPWDHLAVKARHDAALLFGKGRYSQVAEIFAGLAQRVSGGEKHLYKALRDISEGYGLWDNFQYKPAWERLKPSAKSLEMATVFGGPAGLKAFSSRLKDNLGFLEKLAVGTPDIRQEHFLDLLANSRRRADLERNYDDAFVRLYRAAAAFAQIRLQTHGITASNVETRQLPDEVRSEFSEKYRDVIDNRIRLPLYGAFKVLELFKDPAGSAFFDHWSQMKMLLDCRNRSILVHGLDVIKKDRFDEMFRLVCRISKTDEAAIPGFPDLRL